LAVCVHDLRRKNIFFSN